VGGALVFVALAAVAAAVLGGCSEAPAS
jgi:hypothetical protein